eukprot:4116967-Pyramimonas_sp.AAC.1
MLLRAGRGEQEGEIERSEIRMGKQRVRIRKHWGKFRYKWTGTTSPPIFRRAGEGDWSEERS